MTADTPAAPDGGSDDDPRAEARARRRADRKALKRIGHMLDEAEGEAHKPPQFLLDPQFGAALGYWRQMAPRLAERHLLGQFDRQAFAMLCYYMQEWVAAVDDIARNGFSMMVPTVSGGMMDRPRWSVRRRDQAEARVMDLSAKFGLTPTDRFDLYGKLTRSNYDPQRDMFSLPKAGDEGDGKGSAEAEAPRQDGWSHLLDGPAKPN